MPFSGNVLAVFTDRAGVAAVNRCVGALGTISVYRTDANGGCRSKPVHSSHQTGS